MYIYLGFEFDYLERRGSFVNINGTALVTLVSAWRCLSPSHSDLACGALCFPPRLSFLFLFGLLGTRFFFTFSF